MPDYSSDITQAFGQMDQGIAKAFPAPTTLGGSLGGGNSTGDAVLDQQIRAKLNLGDVSGAMTLLNQRALSTPASGTLPAFAAGNTPAPATPGFTTQTGTGQPVDASASSPLTLPNAQGLNPTFSGNLNTLFSAWNQQHPDVRWTINSGYRTPEEQARLKGYHANPGDSAHQLGAAVDLVPVVGGRPLSGADAAPYRSQLGAMAPQFGVYWGGNWRKPDYPHFQAYPGFQQRDQYIAQNKDWLDKQGYDYN